MRHLIIGGAGLIGSHIVDVLLDRGEDDVVVVDDLSRGQRRHVDPQARFIEADLLSSECLREVERADVVYLAAAKWLLEVERFPEDAMRVNAFAPGVIAHRMRDGATLVYSSSASVYGDTEPGDPPLTERLTERSPLGGAGHLYGASKIAAEALLDPHRKHLAVAALRYANVYGPRMDGRGAYMGVLAAWLNRALKGLPPLVSHPHARYDFVLARDVARANVLAAEQRLHGTYNVCSGVSPALLGVAHMVCLVTGCPAPQPMEGAARPPVLRRVMSPALFAELTGYTPRPLSTGALEELWAWWQAEHEEVL